MGQWVLDLEDGRLSAEHATASLSPRSAAVLACLIKRAGAVVSRKQILQDVWKDIHVSPDLVREYIFELRKALDDDPKNPRFIETVGRRGFRLIGDISLRSGAGATRVESNVDAQADAANRVRPGPERPTAKYCRSRDGVSLAHASSGEGYPLLFAGSWMTHVEMDWDSPAYGDYVSHLSDRFQVIRYDQRGNGLSQWADVDIAFDRMVEDMEAVIDTYRFEKVAILGMSQGASVSIAYAVRHPHRVSHLVLNGGYARGRRQRGNDRDREESEALVNLIRNNWGNDNPAIRQTLTTLFMPDASKQEMEWFNTFQKVCGPSENIAQFRTVFDEMNVSGLLSKVSVPTLVLHSDRDSVAPVSEGKYLAANIPSAVFQQLSSRNHMLFAREPDFPILLSSIESFIGPDPSTPPGAASAGR